MTNEIGIQPQMNVDYSQREDKHKSLAPAALVATAAGVGGYFSPVGLQKAKYSSVDDIVREISKNDKFDTSQAIEMLKEGKEEAKSVLDSFKKNWDDVIKGPKEALEKAMKKVSEEGLSDEALKNAKEAVKNATDNLNNAKETFLEKVKDLDLKKLKNIKTPNKWVNAALFALGAAGLTYLLTPKSKD